MLHPVMKWGGTCYYIYSKNARNRERRFDTSIENDSVATATANFKTQTHKKTSLKQDAVF
ncbi:MAG: hypothetical protein ACLT2J_12985 [[Clostridium] innocuum]|uniref:hypothetical protein n=2 Tax=Bacillota TaxID=1239 RepID=UPI00030955BC|nr:hypothetical protein [[Clostridium] innocuum]MCR0400582.1 hypothetical protein [[Clostridium] innocuum]UOX48660.1 hypothetical protein K5I27_12170 [[Clostridium] innocuum]